MRHGLRWWVGIVIAAIILVAAGCSDEEEGVCAPGFGSGGQAPGYPDST